MSRAFAVATSFAAQVGAWVLKTERRMTIVTQQATNDLIKNIPIKDGLTRGGSRPKGSIPRDNGAIARSLQSSLYGSTGLTGPESYSFVVGAMKAGDKASFVWGGAAAPHARANHYGFRGVQGTMWIPEAAAKWQGYVDAAIVRAKAQVR